jgi:hypothetical protein
MDPALAALDFAKAGAILADMIASCLAAGALPFDPEGPDDHDLEDRRSTPIEAGLHIRSPVDAGAGPVISPCLSNIFLHHVLDEWFEFEVRPRLTGRCTLIRFADDAVLAFEDFLDAKRVLGVLGKRLARYGLTLHPDKTRFVDFGKHRDFEQHGPEALE